MVLSGAKVFGIHENPSHGAEVRAVKFKTHAVPLPVIGATTASEGYVVLSIVTKIVTEVAG